MKAALQNIRGARIFLKFAGTSLLTMAVVGMGMVAVILVSQKRAYEEEMKARWMGIARIAGRSLENALLVDDFDFLEGLSSILAREEDITSCRVFNRDGHTLSLDGYAEARAGPLVTRCLVDGEPIMEDRPGGRGASGLVEIAQPIVFDDEVWGVVRITCSRAGLDRLTRDLYGRLGLMAIVCGGLGLLGSLLMAKHMSGPVVRLARLAQHVAEGNLDVKCALRRRDELGDLANSFDRMVTNLGVARNELEGAHRYMESILESMVDSVIVVEHPPILPGAGPRIKTANRAALDLLGYRESELIGQSVDLVLGSGRRREDLLARTIRTGTVRNVEAHYYTRTEARRDMLLSAAAMAGPGRGVAHGPEEITAFVFVASDITDLKRAEKVRMATQFISESVSREESLPELYEAVHEVIRELMPADVLQIALADGERQTPDVAFDSRGLADPGGEGTLAEYISRLGRPIHLTAPQLEDLAGKREVTFEGAPPVECLGSPLRLGDGIVGMLAVQSMSKGRPYHRQDLELLTLISDQLGLVIERKRAEEERLRLSLAVEQAADGIIITDTRGLIRYVNPAFTRICGYTRDDAIGHNTSFLWSGEHDRRAFVRLWRGVAQGQQWVGRMPNRRKDGSKYEVDVAVSPVRSPTDEVVNFVAVCHDVTNEVALEAQLRQAQKMEAVGQLAGGIAHDFNNLLSIITGYTSLYLRQRDPEEPAIEMLHEVNKAGTRAAALTRQLLAFSRRQVLKPQVLNLNGIIADIEKMLRRLIGEDIELITNLDPSLGSVRVDPGQVEQVVMNLALNSRDAMPGGGRLTIETRNFDMAGKGLVGDSEVQPGPYAMLVVTDSGLGMDGETLSRVFEPFFTTKDPGKGTGLGLSTVYGIVTQSEGYIDVQSQEGGGTSFQVYFPRIAVDSRPSAGAAATVPDALRGEETILIVEDEAGVRKMSEHLLSQHGYRVLTAENGVEALKLCKAFREPIHLLLTDVIMPEMSGNELAIEIKRSRPGTKVIYMSGYTDAAIARHGVLEPGTEFVEKPFDLEFLLRRVREVLDARKAERARR